MPFDDLTGQFISLTTFRRDGTPVPTTVWFAHAGDDLVVGTSAGTGKVKRIRANAEVTAEQCNYRGKSKGGVIHVGSARILDGDEVERADAALRSKYGWQWRLAGGRIDTYIAVSPGPG